MKKGSPGAKPSCAGVTNAFVPSTRTRPRWKFSLVARAATMNFSTLSPGAALNVTLTPEVALPAAAKSTGALGARARLASVALMTLAILAS